MKRYIISLFLALALVCPVFAEPAASPSPSPSPVAEETLSEKEKELKAKETTEANGVTLHCQAALLMDRKTGEILFEKNKSEKVYPASTTKIMTAILALEHGTLTDTVTATHEAIDPITIKHSHMGILVGEELTLEQLLYGMLVYSANDAANVIGVHIGGSLQGFVDMMNQKAAELGMTNTHFANAHGFHDDNHYTTAEDMAVLARYAMQNEMFRKIVSTGLYRIPPTNKYQEERVLSSTNHLISRYRNTKLFYKYAIGIKTGFTDEAGNCLVSAATKDDMELICVVMNATNLNSGDGAYSFVDSKNLFEWVFNNYHYCQIAVNGDVVADSVVYEAKNQTRVALTPEQTIEKLLPKDVSVEDITAEPHLPENIRAPIQKGDHLGEIVYSYQGKELSIVGLVATNDVEKDYILAAIHIVVKVITSPILWISLIALILLVLMIRSNRRKKRRRKRSRARYNGR